MDITQPLRLAKGSRQAGSGQGCAMNVISWENGDATVTDYPSCSARPLATLVQRVNDNICCHTSDHMLCPECSQVVLDLGHRTVGTGRYTCDQLRLWLNELRDNPVWGYRQYINDALATNTAAAYAANAVDYARAADASSASAYAYAYATNTTNAAFAASYAVTYASNAYAAAYAANAVDARIRHARHAIDAWHRVCGTSPRPISEETTLHAIRQMQEVR